MFKNIIVLISLLALVCGAAQGSKKQTVKITQAQRSNTEQNVEKSVNEKNNEISSSEVIEILSEEEDDDNENSSQELLESKIRSQVAEEEIKQWINKLNCRRTPMGAMKCIMVKRGANNFYKNPNRDLEMMKIAIMQLIDILRADNEMDPELEMLVNKHKTFLYDD